ncbi:MAG: hypothetical protein NTV06_06170 [candidate division Zixibacteria bacterium]|nr:hypothetical protein [candidate division Zixibacteria bacterium]
MEIRSNYKTALIIFSLLIFSAPAFGQILYGAKPSGNLQMIYSHWNLKRDNQTTKIHQLMVPMGGFIPLGENFEASFYMANSSNKLNIPDKEFSLSGASNLQFQVSHSFLSDVFLVSGGINLPTGKTELNLNKEWLVAEYLARDYLGFPMSRFGEGFGYNLLLGGATMLGSIRCGAGLAYQYCGSYKPYNEASKYKPGNYFSINIGADLRTGAMTYNSDIIYTSYAKDEMDNHDIFKQSSQFDIRFGGLFDNQVYNIALNMRYLIRGRNTQYRTDESILEQLKIYGNEFSAAGKISWYFTKDWYVAPSAEWRSIAANEEGFGESNIFGIGGNLGRKIGKKADFGFGLKFLSGDADAGHIELSGYQITTNLTAYF